MLKATFFVLFLLFMTGCGRYGPPLPPEALSPQAVQELEVTAELGAVRFRWKSPEKDRRGKELSSLNGYELYRATLSPDSSASAEDLLGAPEVQFEEYVESPEDSSEKLAFLEDTSIRVREALRADARSKGLPPRKVRVQGQLKKFEFTDQQVKPGKEYMYMVVPINQDGVQGEVLQYVRVRYRGDTSEITLIDRETLLGEL